MTTFYWASFSKSDIFLKAFKKAKIKNRYNQVPHLTQDVRRESDKNTIRIAHESQVVSLFPAGEHKAAMNRQKAWQTPHTYNINDPQKKHRLGTVSKINFTGGWKLVSRRQLHP